MKRIWIIAIVLLWALPGFASAHSYMEESSPAKDETVAASPAQIEMTFNTDIEKLSSFKLYNEAGEEMNIGATAVNGAVLSGPVEETLQNGSYTVKWTIIGEDGHSVKGEYGFAVEAAEQPSPSEAPATSPDASPVPSDQPADSAGQASEPLAGSGDTAAAADSGGGSSMTAAIVIGVIIIAAAVILIVRSRKR